MILVDHDLIHNWCWSWNSNTLTTWCGHLKRSQCWERLKAGGEGNDRGWDGWMASPTQWTWVWVNSRSWWWTGRPGVLRFMGLQRVGHDWVTELNWIFIASWSNIDQAFYDDTHLYRYLVLDVLNEPLACAALKWFTVACLLFFNFAAEYFMEQMMTRGRTNCYSLKNI